MEIVSRQGFEADFTLIMSKAKQKITIFLFLFCFGFFNVLLAQSTVDSVRSRKAIEEYNNGNFRAALEIAKKDLEFAKKKGDDLQILKCLEVIADSQIYLANYSEAEITLNENLRYLNRTKEAVSKKAELFMHFAWLYRSQLKFTEAIEFSKKAIELAPGNHQIEGEYALNMGRILFASGYDYSAIIWLEKAEKIFENEKISLAKIDTYRYLTLTWSSRLNYLTALNYSEKWISSADKTKYKYRFRQSLFESATLLDETGQKTSAIKQYKNGLALSKLQKNSYQACLFLTSLMLNSFNDEDIKSASDYLNQLENFDTNSSFAFEIKLGKAIVVAYSNPSSNWKDTFAELSKMEDKSDYIIPYWMITIAERNKDWDALLKINDELLKITERDNFRSGQPGIYLNFARVYYKLNQIPKALENAEKSISLIEEIRQTDNNPLSLGILETYHKAYRLLTQLKSKNTSESFELADYTKARLLKDKIENSSLKSQPGLPPTVRKKLEDLSLKFIDDQKGVAPELEKYEKSITATVPELNLAKPDLAGLEKISELNDAAVISYFFTTDQKLTAYVWEKGKPLKVIDLNLSESEVDGYAKTSAQKIKDFIFFKKDGREIYEKLLKPLNTSAKHLIIIPDKSLWKIPFQALSPDGEKYLIEEKIISYAPSVSILMEQLKTRKQNRQTLLAFANPTYENRTLQFVNAEATSVAEIYNVKPKLNATVADFKRIANKADILHFSMHAQVETEQPLESFLAFKKIGEGDGRLTVEDIFNIKLKKGSLVFLASCDTNNVLNGEGLVSLSWAMMGSGATSVVSAGWEANDRSTQDFAKAFYVYYKQGNSAAEAMQMASLDLIRNKSNNAHEPYYWANFTLSGDFR